jgi:hypothetical protein
MKYRGVRNICTAEWDPYESLPSHYAKIFRFSNFIQARKESLLASLEQGLPICNALVTLILSPLDAQAE